MSALNPVTGVTATWNHVQGQGSEGALTGAAALALAAVVALGYLIAYLVVFVGPFLLFWGARGVRWDSERGISSKERSGDEQLSCEALRALANDLRGRALPLPGPSRRLPSPRRGSRRRAP